MPVFVGGPSGAIGARLVPRLIDHGHAEPITLDQQPARMWRHTAGSS
jgi:hypothetical protein